MRQVSCCWDRSWPKRLRLGRCRRIVAGRCLEVVLSGADAPPKQSKASICQQLHPSKDEVNYSNTSPGWPDDDRTEGYLTASAPPWTLRACNRICVEPAVQCPGPGRSGWLLACRLSPATSRKDCHPVRQCGSAAPLFSGLYASDLKRSPNYCSRSTWVNHPHADAEIWPCGAGPRPRAAAAAAAGRLDASGHVGRVSSHCFACSFVRNNEMNRAGRGRSRGTQKPTARRTCIPGASSWWVWDACRLQHVTPGTHDACLHAAPSFGGRPALDAVLPAALVSVAAAPVPYAAAHPPRPILCLLPSETSV